MADEKIFCGLVSPKFEGQLLAVKLDVPTLSPHAYDDKDRDGNKTRSVDINVRISKAGNWYVEVDTYKPADAAPEPAPAPRPAEAPPVEDVVDDSIPF